MIKEDKKSGILLRSMDIKININTLSGEDSQKDLNTNSNMAETM